MAKGYAIAQITINDMEAYKPYLPEAMRIAAKYTGRYLVRGGRKEVMEGEAVGERMVVIEFDSFELARQFYECEEYQQIIGIRQRNSTGLLILVEGYDG